MANAAKITCIFKDGSSVKYTIRKKQLIPDYIGRHSGDPNIKSITVQEYPFKDNKPIDWLKKRR